MTAFFRRCLGGSVLWLGVLGAPAAHGQASWVTLSGGYGIASLKWPSLTQFLDSYAAANPPGLTDKPTLRGGMVQSVLADVAGFGCIGFQRLTANPVARFASGGERTFAIHQNLLVAAVEPSFQTANIFLGAVGGMYAGTVRVATSFRYPDGTRSWGTNLPLNGDYGTVTLGGYLGAKAGISWKALAVTLRAEYFSKGLVKSGLTDKSGGKNTTANAFGGQTSPDALPLDYSAYLASPYEYSLADHSVADDLRSWRVQVQVGLMLFPLDSE